MPTPGPEKKPDSVSRRAESGAGTCRPTKIGCWLRNRCERPRPAVQAQIAAVRHRRVRGRARGPMSAVRYLAGALPGNASACGADWRNGAGASARAADALCWLCGALVERTGRLGARRPACGLSALATASSVRYRVTVDGSLRAASGLPGLGRNPDYIAHQAQKKARRLALSG